MMLLYSLGLTLAAIVSSPWWMMRMLTTGRYREGLAERLGRVPLRINIPAQTVWLHAVSVGEVLAAAHLIESLEAAGHSVTLSTTTTAAQSLARKKYGDHRVFYFPLDFAFSVRPWLHSLQPSLLILMESELWPRVLTECERAGVPVVVVNARVSDRSLPRYLALKKLWQPLLKKITRMLAQSEEDAERWRLIGAPRVETTGNLKYDSVAPTDSPLATALLQHTTAPFLIAGSTLEGEEELLLNCWPSLSHLGVLLLAPRHPQRFEDVANLLQQSKLRHLRIGAWKLAPEAIGLGDVLLLDTIGDLAALYALARVAFVGGSLVPAGGHNPLEPARFGVPVVMGTHYANFRDIAERMIAADALRIVTAERLCGTLRAMLQTPNTALGERGREFFLSQSGATARTMALLLPLLHERKRG